MRSKAALLMLCVALACTNVRAPGPEPKNALLLNTPRINFGEVREADVAQSTIEVHNASAQTATLTGSAAGCSCFRLAKTSFPIPVAPGETVALAVEFDARGQHGLLERQIMLLHDVIHQDALVVVATGFVRCPMWALQDAVVWPSMSNSTEHRGYVDIESGDLEPWQVLDVSNGAGRSIAWHVEDRVEAGRRLRRVLLQIPRLADGEVVSETLRIATSHPLMPFVLVDSRLEVRGTLESLPARLNFGAVSSSEGRSMRCSFFLADRTEAVVSTWSWHRLDGTPWPEVAKYLDVARVEGRAGALAITAAHSDKSGQLSAALRVQGGRAGQQVSVPVTVLLR